MSEVGEQADNHSGEDEDFQRPKSDPATNTVQSLLCPRRGRSFVQPEFCSDAFTVIHSLHLAFRGSHSSLLVNTDLLNSASCSLSSELRLKNKGPGPNNTSG